MEEKKTEPNLIHVPQGRSARAIRSNLPFGIEGFFTDGFSNCIIVACIGKDKITLTHADIRTNPAVIRTLIKWVGEPNETIIISRGGREKVFNQVVPYLKSEFRGKTFITQCMPVEYDGTIVSFNTHPEYYIHPQIRKLPISLTQPKNLLRHPQEERFLAVTNIEQVIGHRAARTTQQKPLYQQIIFDGYGWEPLDEKELVVNTSHHLTREEMAIFTANDTYNAISLKLTDLLKKDQQQQMSLDEIYEFTDAVTCPLESYLNNFDALKIFRRNINDTITCKKYALTSSEDIKFKTDVLEALKGNEFVFERIQALFAEYKKTTHESGFKKMIYDEFAVFSEHYHERLAYREMDSFYKEKRRTLALTTLAGMKHLQAGEYAAASSIFREALKMATLCCLKSSVELVRAHFDLGRSLQQEAKYQEAFVFLCGAFSLRENYVKSTPAEIERVKKILDECRLQVESNIGATDVPETKSLSL